MDAAPCCKLPPGVGRTGAVAAAAPGLREIRLRRELSQSELARLSGLHRNSIRKIESGETYEVDTDTAAALARALRTTIDALGIRVRNAAETPPSVRMRQLTREQREVIAALLALPERQFEAAREAIHALRPRRGAKRGKGEKR